VIFYLAGTLENKLLERIANYAGANHFLCSFASKGAQKNAKYFCEQPHRRIFVDSGAFSAWTKGQKIDLGDYMVFCKQVASIAKCPVVFAALDVIPGKKGDRNATQAEIQMACDEGWDNYQAMKREGIAPCLMTFHQLEHRRQLTRIADDSDYFAVSPRKDLPTRERLHWLENVFSYLGRTKRIHGLGVSSVDWMERFPFFSVDNTGWLPSVRANLRRIERRTGPIYTPLSYWKKFARRHGIHTRYLREMLGFSAPGEKPDPEANRGIYFRAWVAMECDVETQSSVTELWRSKGVDWEEQRDIKPLWTSTPWWKETDPDDSPCLEPLSTTK
jgi:hypothetical protein